MEDLRNTELVEVDLSGSQLRGAILVGVRVRDAWIHDVELSGDVRGLTVNGVEVGAYVEAELDRRHPERVALRATDPDGLRHAWSLVEAFADRTLERAAGLPAELLDASVDGEWSFLETQRHLVFATDRWITDGVLGEDVPFHPLGRPNDPLDEVPPGIFDLDARPSLAEVVAIRRDRRDRVAALLAGVDAAALDREVASPNGGTTTLGHCLQVVLREEWWHDRYANRDLDRLTAPDAAG